MRTVLAATLLLVLAAAPAAPAAPAAEARTFQRGVVTYSASGSWTTTTRVSGVCDAPSGDDTVDERTFTYPVVERGSFTTGRGTAHYQGDVDYPPFFLGNGDRPARMRFTVTRTAVRPVQCDPPPVEDCGTRTRRGVARSEFPTPISRRRPVDLRLSFGDRATAPYLTDPFNTCGATATSLLLNQVSRGTSYPNLQDAALRYPSVKTFWARKRLTLHGTGTAKGVVFSMTLKTSRRTTSSRHAR